MYIQLELGFMNTNKPIKGPYATSKNQFIKKHSYVFLYLLTNSFDQTHDSPEK
jgi:hypothetical protein